MQFGIECDLLQACGLKPYQNHTQFGAEGVGKAQKAVLTRCKCHVQTPEIGEVSLAFMALETSVQWHFTTSIRT